MQGTGNDFVMIDQFNLDKFDLSQKQVQFICNRKFGVGADGLIILRDHPETDFEMVYFNSDGNLSSMCGNGARCIVRLAYDHRYIEEETKFKAPDGLHHATIDADKVYLGMSDVADYASANDIFILDTGSPHYVTFVNDVDALNVKERGAEIRYSPPYSEQGINVNFVELISEDSFKIRTYERGVEDETLSCGTGVTAAAIAACLKSTNDIKHWKVKAKGGDLEVSFVQNGSSFNNIKLIGPAENVFEGKILLEI